MKIVIWLLIAVMLTGIVYAFSTCRAEQSDGRVELTMFSYPYPDLIKINRKRLAIFERENPDIKVRLVTGYADKYLTMVTGGVPPDIAYAGHVDIPYFAKRNAIMPLDKFIAKDKDFSLDDYFPCAVESVRYRGKIYALPEEGSPVAVFYNKNLFDQYNKEHPDKPLTYPSGKWTWADFRHAAKALTQDRDGDGQTDVYGASISFWRNRWPIPVWQNGGEVISKDKKRCLMDSPEAIAGIRWLYEMVWVDKSAPTAYTQIAGVSEQQESIRFREQRIAMIMTTRYYYSDLKQMNFEWDIAPLPRGRTSGVSLYLSAVQMISAETHYPQKAWRLAKFLVGERSSEICMRSGRSIASNMAVAERVISHPNMTGMPAHDHLWIDIISNSRPKDFEYREMGRYFIRAMDEMSYIAQGRRKPEEACRNFARIYQKGLDVLWEEEGGP
ncbi:MAG: sugar ABC transporter substrate-binding protein [Phycisphaerae bacterium]|nr:sugar ABC transporter substrate-binding protein [Phycisphaerae bacterium]